MAGKGDRRRPTNETKYRENYDSIFRKKKKVSKKKHARKL